MPILMPGTICLMQSNRRRVPMLGKLWVKQNRWNRLLGLTPTPGMI
jgi:hypothetical protein